MRLEVWGLGHCGLVCAASLALKGHRVVGVDIDAQRVARLNAGETHIHERGLSERVATAVASGHLVGTLPDRIEPEPLDVVIVCLPTPAVGDQALDTRSILITATRLAPRIRACSHFPMLVVRSTVPVHFTRNALQPLLEGGSGKAAGIGFGLAMVPEFLREGHALEDFDQPSLIVLGADDPASMRGALRLFEDPPCRAQQVSTAVAEFFKLTNNAFHALKIGFANEIARMANAQRLDGHEVLRLLCEDSRLNLSPAYLAPGFAFGGACLDKDLGALRSLAAPPEAPILAAIGASNRAHLDACLRAIRSRSWRRLGFYGVTNKAGTDDLRNSPVLALIDALELPPGALLIYDPDLRADQAPFLRDRYRAEVVGNMRELREQVDLIVNCRSDILPDSLAVAQLQFAAHWRGA
jgi:GDP-mannose 6-dehydrogenase